MLITRVAPSLTRLTQVNLRYASCPSVFLQSVAGVKNFYTSEVIGREQNNFLCSTTTLNSTNLTVCKAYSTKQPELPSKQELEKYFFKVTVVIWDLIWKIALWSFGMFKKYIIENPTVQSNWKTFNQKLEEARKN